MNAAASSNYQPKGDWESRTTCVMVKATDSTRIDPERVLDLPGVGATARFQRLWGNRRGPTWQPTLGKDQAYKA
jgi:hypothetical protein